MTEKNEKPEALRGCICKLPGRAEESRVHPMRCLYPLASGVPGPSGCTLAESLHLGTFSVTSSTRACFDAKIISSIT